MAIRVRVDSDLRVHPFRSRYRCGRPGRAARCCRVDRAAATLGFLLGPARIGADPPASLLRRFLPDHMIAVLAPPVSHAGDGAARLPAGAAPRSLSEEDPLAVVPRGDETEAGQGSCHSLRSGRLRLGDGRTRRVRGCLAIRLLLLDGANPPSARRPCDPDPAAAPRGDRWLWFDSNPETKRAGSPADHNEKHRRANLPRRCDFVTRAPRPRFRARQGGYDAVRLKVPELRRQVWAPKAP